MKNSIDYKAILEKKKPTGYEVGLLLFSSILHKREQGIAHQTGKDLFTQKEFTEAESRLSDIERERYEPYRLLYSSILDTFNNLLSSYDLFTSSFNCIYFRASQLYEAAARQLHTYITPLLVTESEYKTLYQQTKERIEQEEGKDREPDNADIALTIRGREKDITPESYYKHFRALAGIGVIKFPLDSILDEKQKFNDLEKDFSLVDLYKELENNKVTIDRQYRNIKKVASSFYAYSVLLEIIERVYKIPRLKELLELQKTTNSSEKLLSILDNRILEVRKYATSAYYTDSQIEQNLHTLEKIFPSIDIKTLKPTPRKITIVSGAIEETYNTLENLQLLKDLKPFIRVLQPEEI